MSTVNADDFRATACLQWRETERKRERKNEHEQENLRVRVREAGDRERKRQRERGSLINRDTERQGEGEEMSRNAILEPSSSCKKRFRAVSTMSLSLSLSMPDGPASRPAGLSQPLESNMHSLHPTPYTRGKRRRTVEESDFGAVAFLQEAVQRRQDHRRRHLAKGGRAALSISKHGQFTRTKEIKRNVTASARNHPEG